LSEVLPEGIAENFIPVEESLPVNTDSPDPAVETGLSPAETAAIAALTETYVKRNYEYIQRRIREKLVYPVQARRAGLQGSAELSFTIHEDGSVSDVTVTQSSGSGLLDTAAMDAIYASAPFRPPPAQARIVIPVSFRLR
jgi:protein TonB